MKILKKLENFIVLTFLGLMGGVLSIQIFMRYVVNKPLIWSEEIARYLFVWVAFIGASYGVREKAHIRMEIIFKSFPKRVQKYLQLFIYAISIACFLYLVPVGIEFTKQQHYVLSSAMSIPMSYIFAAVPIGCILISFRLILEFLNLLRDKDHNQ